MAMIPDVSHVNCITCVAPWCFHAGKDHLPCMMYVDKYDTVTTSNHTTPTVRFDNSTTNSKYSEPSFKISRKTGTS